MTELLSQLRQETIATVDFVEERYLSYLTEPVIIEGQLTYRTDGRLERQVSRPKREKMTIEGRLLIIEQNAKDPPIRVLLSDHPPLQAFVAALRALLSWATRRLWKSTTGPNLRCRTAIGTCC